MAGLRSQYPTPPTPSSGTRINQLKVLAFCFRQLLSQSLKNQLMKEGKGGGGGGGEEQEQ